MLLNDIGRKYFIDDLQSPTTIADKPQTVQNYTFNNYKQYFTLRINEKAVTTVVNLFDLESYNANPAFYNNNFTVNSSFANPLITNDGQTYEFLLNEIVNNNYLLWWMKIDWNVNSATDVAAQQSVVALQKDANGQFQDDYYPLNQVFDIYQSNLNLVNIDLRPSPVLLDGINYIQFNPSGKTKQLVFFYERVKKSSDLRNLR